MPLPIIAAVGRAIVGSVARSVTSSVARSASKSAAESATKSAGKSAAQSAGKSAARSVGKSAARSAGHTAADAGHTFADTTRSYASNGTGHQALNRSQFSATGDSSPHDNPTHSAASGPIGQRAGAATQTEGVNTGQGGLPSREFFEPGTGLSSNPLSHMSATRSSTAMTTVWHKPKEVTPYSAQLRGSVVDVSSEPFGGVKPSS